MRHHRKGKKFSRDASHRRSLYRNLAVSLITFGSIKTTLAKAKALRPAVERLITLAKKGNLAARRRLLSLLGGNKAAVEKLLGTLAGSFAARPGGYSRIKKLGPRLSDGAEMARIEWVESGAVEEIKADKSKSKTRSVKSQSAKVKGRKVKDKT